MAMVKVMTAIVDDVAAAEAVVGSVSRITQ